MFKIKVASAPPAGSDHSGSFEPTEPPDHSLSPPSPKRPSDIDKSESESKDNVDDVHDADEFDSDRVTDCSETAKTNVVADSNNNKQFFGPDFASVPAKIDKMFKTVNAIKASIDMLEAKSLPQVSKACDVQPNDDHIDSLVVCKSLDDILKNFSALSYNEQLVKCDLCDRKPLQV